MEAPLIIFLVLLLLVGPILGIIAFVGMRRLDEALRRQNPQEVTGRIYAIEQRLAKLEKFGVAAPPMAGAPMEPKPAVTPQDRKSTRLNSSHLVISYAVFCLKKKKNTTLNHSSLKLRKISQLISCIM